MNRPQAFSPAAIARAQPITLLCLDVDGVLTDGHLIYTADGQEAKAFNSQDGAAIKLAQRQGLELAITGRESPMVTRRAAELGIEFCYQGSEAKDEVLAQLLLDSGRGPEAIAHMGDDLADLKIMRRVGLGLAPANAHYVVAAYAHLITEAAGGAGAVREAIEALLTAQDRWAGTPSPLPERRRWRGIDSPLRARRPPPQHAGPRP